MYMHKHPAFRLRGIQRRHRHHLLLCLHATYTPRHPTRLTLSLLLQNVIHIQLPRLCLKMPLWAHRCKRCRHGSKWQERRHLSPRRPCRCEVPERWCERQGVVVIYKCVVVVGKSKFLFATSTSVCPKSWRHPSRARASARCDVQRVCNKSRL